MAFAAFGVVDEAGAWSLEEAAAPYKGTTIRTIGEALPPLEAMKKLAPEFEKRTGITVEIEMYEASETANKVMLDLNSKRGRYDFILQQHRNVGKFVDQRPCRADRAIHGVRRRCAIPTSSRRSSSTRVSGRRSPGTTARPTASRSRRSPCTPGTAPTCSTDAKEKEGFKAKYGYDLGPAQDWKQYRDIAEWFTRPDQGLYGTALQGKRHEALWYEWLNFLYSFGGDMLEVKTGSECGPVIVNSPQAIAATEYYKSLMAFSPPDTLNYFWDDVMALMQQGKVAELIMWNDATYAVAVDESASTVVGKMGFDLVPQGEGGKVGPGRGLDLPHPDIFEEQGSRLSLHPVDDGIRPAAQPAPQRRRLGAARCLCSRRRCRSCPTPRRRWPPTRSAKPKPTIPQASEMTDILVRELSSYLADEKSPRRKRSTQSAKEISALLGSCAPMKYPVQ